MGCMMGQDLGMPVVHVGMSPTLTESVVIDQRSPSGHQECFFSR